MHRLCRLGGHPSPAWLEAWSDVETLKLVSPIKKSKAPTERWPKVPRIEYPEDRLVQSYYARHPEARDHPVLLDSFDPPPARIFAWRQLRLMREQGLSRKEAQRIVEEREEKEMAQKRSEASNQNIMMQVQRQEERALINALNRLPDS
ncbi:g7576 [Coccomyxa viridis]|uniref:G7576 protein n=1 Tax=Coccomyxa viridis TaxID=1274662 RepID=A0ABP1FY56_9CHLO